MIVVISCAGSKNPKAGRLKDKDGTPVEFVAHPREVPDNPASIYVRPDDQSGYGISWRDKLLDYNRKYQDTGYNPDDILPAWQLYKNSIYSKLVNKYGAENTYILSAGWGLIRSDFLTPHYDITFSSNSKVEQYKRRYRKDKFEDWNCLPKDPKGPIVFLGGNNYRPLFCTLAESRDCRKVVFYKAQEQPEAPGCDLKRYNTKTNTNWHYQCAWDLIEGKISINE